MATPLSGKTAPKIINEEQLETLAGMGCTMVEMAAFFKCHVDTLRDNYSSALERGRELGKVSFRRELWNQTKKGNTVALKYFIWNLLGDRIEPDAVLNDSQIAAAELLKKLQSISTDQLLRAVEDKAG